MHPSGTLSARNRRIVSSRISTRPSGVKGMDLVGLKAPRPQPPKLSTGDKKVQSFLRDLEKIKNSKRPRKQMQRSEELIYRIVQTLRRTDSDHLLYTTCIWTLINIFRMFPDFAKEIMLEVGVPSVLHQVIASGLLTGSMRQYTSELCFFLSSNEPYPGPGAVPQVGPLPKLPEVNTANRYNGILDDVSVASSDMSSTVPEGHRDHSKYAFVPYRINDQNLRKLEDLFKEGYEKQVAAALPNPQFMSRFGFVGANARQPYAGTGTGIGGEDWQLSDSDDEDEDLRNHDDGSVNSTISSGSRSLAYSASSGTLSAGTVSMGGSVQSGRYSFSSGVSGQGLPIVGTATHGIGIGIHNRQMGKFAASALGMDRLKSAPTLTTLAMKDYESWHQRHGPHENPFHEEMTPLTTHYRPSTISTDRARVTHFRIGGFGVGPAAARDVNAASAAPTLGADYPKGGKRDRDEFELLSQSASLTLSQLSNDPFHRSADMTHSQELAPDMMSNTYPASSSLVHSQQQQGHSRQARHAHTRAIQHSKSLNEDSWSSARWEGKRTDEFDPVQRGGGPAAPNTSIGIGGMFDTRSPLRSIASSQYGERPSDLLQHRLDPASPSTSLLDVSPPRRALQTAGQPSRPFPSLTGAVHPPRKDRSPAHPSTAPHLQAHKRGDLAEQSSTSATGLDALMAQLDPLSLSLNAVRTADTAKSRRQNTVGRKVGDTASRGSWASDEEDELATGFRDDMGDDSDADEQSQDSATEDGYFDSHIVDAPGSKFNEFLARKKMRIRAEKLIDHKFTRKLFVKKATTAQAQNLIARMESLLQLMDPQSTGFVTWECFARLILAVAPSHLLRADVMAFMQAQTDNDQNLIDYKEFVISGKVMVIDMQKTRKDNLPVMGWLNRQKLYSGDESTHTWQNHIKWYQSRKSKAVVWLMRRATRSMRYSVLLEEAQKFLMNQRKRALAVTYLLELGYTAVNSQGQWKEATRNLLKRAMHARRWSQTVTATQAWLANLAKGVVEQLKIEDEMSAALDDASVQSMSTIESVMNPVRKKQADYATFYKLHQYNVMAFKFLTTRAERALQHCAKQDAVQVQLKTHAYRMLMHQLYTESARSWLQLAGERAYKYCIYCDDTLKYLMRRGQHALQYMDRQEAALKWLLNRGREAQEFVESKADALFSLVAQGQRTLAFLNAREEAFAALVVRRKKAVVIVARKKEALIFLAKQPIGLWANMDKIERTQEWLAQRGAQALLHLERRAKTFQLLQLTAGKAANVMRRQNIAFTDLQQFGQEAKITRFAQQCKTVPQYAQRVREERTRIMQTDAKKNKERASLPKVERWRCELADAFDWIAHSITPVGYQGGKKPLIGRIGFIRLLQYGKLLGTTKDIATDMFKAVDPGTACFVPFEDVWTWFLHHAQSYEAAKLAPNNKVLKFRLAEIIPAEVRAQVAILKRVNLEKVEWKSSMDWDALEEKRRKAAEEASSSEEEEDPYEDIDDDTLFSDPRYMQSADIGRMMRYLTKRKQKRDREALEEAYQAELTAKIVASAKLAEAARRSAKTAPFSPSAKVSAESPAPVSPEVHQGEEGTEGAQEESPQAGGANAEGASL